MSDINKKLTEKGQTPLADIDLALSEIHKLYPIEKGKKVLDMGCGDLRIGEKVKDTYSADVTGIELDEEIYEAFKNSTKVTVLKGDGTTLDWSIFDTIVFSYVDGSDPTKQRDNIAKRIKESGKPFCALVTYSTLASPPNLPTDRKQLTIFEGKEGIVLEKEVKLSEYCGGFYLHIYRSIK